MPTDYFSFPMGEGGSEDQEDKLRHLFEQLAAGDVPIDQMLNRIHASLGFAQMEDLEQQLTTQAALLRSQARAIDQIVEQLDMLRLAGLNSIKHSYRSLVSPVDPADEE
jgi:hypothetical protein